MSDTEDEYEQMLVKALQLALEEDREERSQNADRDQQIESRKKLVPKSMTPMPKRSDVERIEEQETSNSNENQAEKQSRHAKDQDETPNGGNASDGVETNEDAGGKNHNDETHDDEKMTGGDENEDQSSSPSPTPLSTITPPSVPSALHSKRAPSSPPDNELTIRPIFITQSAVPSEHMRTLHPLWTAKTEMAELSQATSARRLALRDSRTLMSYSSLRAQQLAGEVRVQVGSWMSAIYRKAGLAASRLGDRLAS